MVGYTALGASDAQWFANQPQEVWEAVTAHLTGKKIKSKDDRAMRLEVNLGMSAFTGNVVASVAVQPAPQGGSMLNFNGRMGAFSQGQIGAQQRIEKERTALFNGVASRLPEATAPVTSAPLGATGDSLSVADELAKLAKLKEDGILSEAEFVAQKARLLG